MSRKKYRLRSRSRARKLGNMVLFIAGLLIVIVLCVVGFHYLQSEPIQKTVNSLQFDQSLSEDEKQIVLQAINNQSIKHNGPVNSSVVTVSEVKNSQHVLDVYVPVVKLYSARQNISKTELSQSKIYVIKGTNSKVISGLANLLSVDVSNIKLISSTNELKADEIALISANQLSPSVKLLALDDVYYLDSFTSGAIFRSAKFTGSGAGSLSSVNLNKFPTKDSTLKINMTGVTALTRLMMKKLSVVNDPLYFSEKIGDFLADADITHISNEVSFMNGCQYNNTVFCSPPTFIETLKDSGVDLVELTGNHNNDSGSEYNLATINQYHNLGWHVFGGGVNDVEAAKPYYVNNKQSKIAFLGYNYPDSPGGSPIATSKKAGANSFDYEKIKNNISESKKQQYFTIVDVQFDECYAYPEGYNEYPICDLPIPNQKEVFRKIVDLGADMVIGTQAHQPQIYETYNGKPIYYGLGNLYFEQIQWPGTERGIVLTHYYRGSKLLQTKLTPTVYDNSYQTRIMANDESVKFLERLNTARRTAGL